VEVGSERNGTNITAQVSWSFHVGLNKGEARNALARAVFFNRLGELRDRTYENQRHRASGLNLVVAAIVLWNTVYLERAASTLRERGRAISDDLLAHLSPLGWEHINLTGDYVWKPGGGEKHRPLRQLRLPIDRDDESPYSVRFCPFRGVTPYGESFVSEATVPEPS
jgi:hypothetical protein